MLFRQRIDGQLCCLGSSFRWLGGDKIAGKQDKSQETLLESPGKRQLAPDRRSNPEGEAIKPELVGPQTMNGRENQSPCPLHQSGVFSFLPFLFFSLPALPSDAVGQADTRLASGCE